ncbi:MAG: hypothetical protein EBR09_12025 [Proteobacteria bacterium]|jgi:hypothetical protein|nr:hypothetical protein [Pseudomonadota bacterium]
MSILQFLFFIIKISDLWCVTEVGDFSTREIARGLVSLKNLSSLFSHKSALCATMDVEPGLVLDASATPRAKALELDELLASRASELTGNAQTNRNELFRLFGVWVGFPDPSLSKEDAERKDSELRDHARKIYIEKLAMSGARVSHDIFPEHVVVFWKGFTVKRKLREKRNAARNAFLEILRKVLCSMHFNLRQWPIPARPTVDPKRASTDVAAGNPRIEPFLGSVCDSTATVDIPFAAQAYAESGAASSVSVNQSTMLLATAAIASKPACMSYTTNTLRPPTVKPTPPPSATALLHTKAPPRITTTRAKTHLASIETTTETSLTVASGGKSVVEVSPQKFVSPSDESQPVTKTGEVLQDDKVAVEVLLTLSKTEKSKLLPEKRWHSSWKPHVDETSCSVETKALHDRLCLGQETGEINPNACRRLWTLHHLLKSCQEDHLLTLVVMPQEKDSENCILGWSKMLVHEPQKFNLKVRTMILEDVDGSWRTANGSRSRSLTNPTWSVYELFRKIGVKPTLRATAGVEGDPGNHDMVYHNQWEFKNDDSFRSARQRLARSFSYCPDKGGRQRKRNKPSV